MAIDLGVKVAGAHSLLERDIESISPQDLEKYKWQLEITRDLVRHNIWLCLWRKNTSPRVLLEAYQSIGALENKLLQIQKLFP